MQNQREGRNNLFEMGDPSATFRGFGGFRSMMPSIFGGRDPFDDPFFTRPFGSIYESSFFSQPVASYDVRPIVRAKEPVIQELDSENEGEGEDSDTLEHSRSSMEPSIEHPDDDDANGERKIQSVNHRSDNHRAEGTKTQAHSFSFQTSKVTYGGLDGAYYTSTRARRTGSDGAVLEESKEADRTTGEATHRISRGIHDKGHSVTRKLKSDGKVDTMQALHNLNEDELAGFEDAWKVNGREHLPSWGDGFNMHANTGSSSDEQMGKALWGGWTLPSREQAPNTEGIADGQARSNSYGGRTKKVVRINIE